MKIGVISDTHNYFDPKIPAIFEGVDHILHAGDIGIPKVILDLESIAPVTAVLGNNDTWLNFKETEIFDLAGRRFLLHHIVDVHRPESPIRQRILRENPQAVIFGHSHKQFNQMIGPTLFLNPGYAGKSRFQLPRSVAILHCDGGELRVEFHDLAVDSR